MIFLRLKSLIQAFRRENRGSVSVEFMLILPLLFWWYAASFAFYDAFRAHNVSVKTSYMIGDILSRQTTIDNDYLDGMETFLKYLTHINTDVWLRVSSVKYTTQDGYTIVWSYSTGEALGLTTSELYSREVDEDYLPLMASGETVILAETYVPYDPTYSVGLFSRTWSNVVVTRPRFTSQLVNDDF